MSWLQLLYSKSVRDLVQWSLRFLRDPQALSSTLTALGMLQPRAFGLLKCVETLDSVSNYYKESYMYHNKSICKLSKGGLHHAFSSIPKTNSIPQHHKYKGLITWCTCNMICETLLSVYWLMYSLILLFSLASLACKMVSSFKIRTQRRLDMITCAQKVGVLPSIQHCTKCKSQSKALKTVLNVKAIKLRSMRKEDPAPYPARPPLILLANQENSFLTMATIKQYLSIAVSFFQCYNIRST